jgi:peptidoglycan/LPS O-acetylase OafA/YrhL
MKQTQVTQRRYIKGLDGLRAIAVLGVIIFHLFPVQMIGGWLGVPLFFVLSGYLITDLLIQEFNTYQKIDLKSFYRRRIRRLYPALLAMLLITASMISVFAPELLYNLRAILLTNLTYTYNFWAIGHGGSYFEQFGGQSPFTHLWSLAIEGQFYFLWPFVVWGMLKFGWRRRWIALLLGILALGSAGLMAILYAPDAINRAYYGTDTRVFAILIGAVVAFIWPTQNLPTISERVLPAWQLGNWLAFGLLWIGLLGLDGQWFGTYYGGMFAFTVLTAIVIAMVVHPQSPLHRSLEGPILQYLGTRSYSIYLYQLPVFVLYEKLVPQFQPNIWHALAQLTIVLLLSEWSYQFVERKFRKGWTLKQIVYWLTASRPRFLGALSATLLVLAFTGVGLASERAGQATPKTGLQKRLDQNQARIDAQNKAAERAVKQQAAAKPPRSEMDEAIEKLTAEQKSTIQAFGLDAKTFVAFQDKSVTAIGDSVMLDVAPYLQDLNEKVYVDGQVGRQAYEAPDLIATYKQSDRLAPNVLIALGTNGTINQADVEEILSLAGKKHHVYWVNNHVPTRPWEQDNNTLLQQLADKHDNLTLIDWQAVSQSHPEWFAEDQIHQGATGNRVYSRIVAEAMTQ